MKRYLLIFLGMTMAFGANSQNETDALRYSYLNYNGTARYAGLGGAMGALGADMSAISMNPAGMGKYSRSDFSFTGDLTFSSNDASYDGNTVNATKSNFNVSNLGVVFVKPISFDKATLWKYFQFGVTSSRTNDFHSRSKLEGNNNKSLLTSYADYLYSNNIYLDGVSNFYEGLAYDAFLLDYDSLSGEFNPRYNEENADIKQNKNTITRGAQYQTDIAVSGNYNGKLMVGASIGFPRIRYNTTSTYTEKILNVDSIYGLESFTMKEEVNTSGSGFNMKIGAIYTPVKFLRLGLALHTPTWYTMDDQFSTSFNSDFVDEEYNRIKISDGGVYNYRLKTPGRIIGSMAFLYKKRGFISLEYEYVDYAGAKLKDGAGIENPYGYDAENNISSEVYKGASILKVGAEFRVTNFWTVRAGYAFYGSPIKDEFQEVDASRTNISGGIGYKNRNFSLDLTYLRSQWKEESFLYDPALVTSTVEDKTLNNFMVTAGFRF